MTTSRRWSSSRPARNVSTGYVSLRRKIKFEKFPFVNDDVSESVDLESGALDCKVCHVEEIKTFRFAISSIYLIKNNVVERFGEKFAVFLYKVRNPLFFDLQRKS